jgi:preprotein translocase subunit SecY
VRPGQGTADYLHNAMSRITLAGAVFLTIIATIPIILSRKMSIDQNVAQFFGGTSILIAVGVLLDTMRQVESHLMMRHYDGFLKKGRVRGRF